MFTALGTLHLLKVDAADSVGRDRVSALRAETVERSPNFFQIDFLLQGHLPTFNRNHFQFPALSRSHQKRLGLKGVSPRTTLISDGSSLSLVRKRYFSRRPEAENRSLLKDRKSTRLNSSHAT